MMQCIKNAWQTRRVALISAVTPPYYHPPCSPPKHSTHTQVCWWGAGGLSPSLTYQLCNSAPANAINNEGCSARWEPSDQKCRIPLQPTYIMSLSEPQLQTLMHCSNLQGDKWPHEHRACRLTCTRMRVTKETVSVSNNNVRLQRWTDTRPGQHLACSHSLSLRLLLLSQEVSLAYTGRFQTCEPKGMQTGSAG